MRPDLSAYRSLVHPILERAEREPDWPGIVVLGERDGREVLTAARLADEILAYADGLVREGITAGDVVVLALDHSPRLVVLFFAVMAAGGVPTILPAYIRSAAELEAQTRRTAALVQATAASAVLVESSAPQWDVGARVLAASALEGRATAEARQRALSLDRSALAFVQYSSGSAGRPKGIAHTHDTVLRFLEARRVLVPVEESDVIVSWLPLYHDFGLVSSLILPETWGVRSVLISPYLWVRDPAVLLETIAAYGGTVCSMPNFALNHMARSIADSRVAGLDLTSWRELNIGAELVRSDSLEIFLRRFERLGFRPQALRAGYGMAEVVEGATCTPTGQRPRVDRIDRGQLARGAAVPAPAGESHALPIVSAGLPFPGVEIRVVSDAGEVLAERHLGEIEIRGPFVMREYHRDPERTVAAFRDGWLRSGDIGYLAEGELFVTGRKKDLIIVGGRNIHPEDIERIADRVTGLHPGRSVAFGVDDEFLGSEKAVIVCETSAEPDPGQWARIERELRGQVAREIGIALGDVRQVGRGWVIKTTSGKTARPLNREKYLQELGDGAGRPGVPV